MKPLCFILLLLNSCIATTNSRNAQNILWNQGTINTTSLEIESDSTQLMSDFITFSSPAIISNIKQENYALYLLEYNEYNELIKNYGVWFRNDLFIENVNDRKFRLLVKNLSGYAIDVKTVSKAITPVVEEEAREKINQRILNQEQAVNNVFTFSNTYQTPLYSAHRGYTVEAPDNSMPSFILAGKRGAWAIETDLRFTKDSIVVCIHDVTLDSRFNGTGKVSDYTYKQLLEMKINVGNNIDEYTDEELRIPTLEEYLKICKKYGSIPFLEFKEDVSMEVINAAKNLKMENYYIVSSSNIEYLSHFRSLSDEVIHHINMKTTSPYLNALALMGNASTSFNLYDPLGEDKNMIEKCHLLGLKVCFRAVDTAEYAKECIDAGIDFLPSNTMIEIK